MTEAIQRARSVARMLADRVAATPTWRPSAAAGRPGRRRDLGVDDLGPRRRAGHRARRRPARPRAAARAAGDRLLRDPGGVGRSPTWRSTPRPAPRPRSTRPRQPEDVLHIVSRLRRGRRVRRGRDQAAVLRELADKTPDLGHVVLLEGAGDGTERELSLDDAGRARPRACWPRTRTRSTTVGRRHRAGPPGHADLHLRHHRPAQGRRADPGQLDVRGRGGRPARHARPRRPAIPVAAAVALVRQGAAGRPAADRLRLRGRRPDRQDRREPRRRCGRRSWPARRGSSRRCTTGWSPSVEARAGSRPSSSTGRSGSAGKVSELQQQGRKPGRLLAAQHALRRQAGAGASCGTASAAGSGSSSPAARRCPARSPSGSTRPAC